MAERIRFDGDVAALTNIVVGYCSEPGWLKYDEDSVKMDRRIITKMWPLVEALETVQPNLSFRKVTLLAVFDKVLEEASRAQRMTEKEKLDWSKPWTCGSATSCGTWRSTRSRSASGKKHCGRSRQLGSCLPPHPPPSASTGKRKRAGGKSLAPRNGPRTFSFPMAAALTTW